MITKGTSADVRALCNFELSKGNEIWSVGAAWGCKVFQLRFDFHFNDPEFQPLLVSTLRPWSHYDPHYGDEDLRGYRSTEYPNDAVCFDLLRLPAIYAAYPELRPKLRPGLDVKDGVS